MKNIIVTNSPESQRDRILLQLLIDNEIFKNYVKSARKVYDIPVDGLDVARVYPDSDGELTYDLAPTSQKIYSALYDNQESFLKIGITVTYINSSFNLGKRWFTPILEAILLGQIITKVRKPVSFKLKNNLRNISPEEDSKKMLKSCSILNIEISEKMTVSQLLVHIKKLDKDNHLSDALNSLSGPSNKPDLSKVKNSKLKSEIYMLKKEGKSYGEIKKIIESKYSQDQLSFELNNQSISEYIDRYRNDLLGLVDMDGFYVDNVRLALNKISEEKVNK